MEQHDHFPDLTPELRHKNELLRELRKNNALLERIAQLLDQPPAAPAQRKERANGQGKRNPQQQTE